ncbi:MAG TPA: hypothetical protein VJT67_12485 [Longimicrobiaceae bacterium]|nr:hypothetical protein [Longimicrobiaceae bacterium]
MENRDHQQRKVAAVAKEIGGVLRRQARKRWETVHTAERNEGNRHVWRFQAGPDGGERFLHVSHEAMQGDDAAATLLEQLRTGRCFERLHKGPETSLLLSKGGRLEAWPVN